MSLQDLPEAYHAARDFSVRVPQGFIAKMQPGNPLDPLLLQVLPTAQEIRDVPGYVRDPLAEQQMRRQAALLHKYRSRVLLVLTGACGINCRYCFRRHFDYQDNRLGGDELHQILEYLNADPGINEVILSGGDPLVLSNRRLSSLLDALETVPHLRRVRIHSRLPVVIPQRIDQGLLARLAASPLRVVLVVHANHAAELDQTFTEAMGYLAAQDVWLLNQSVLLRGVNDSAQALAELSEALFDAGVQPYYLHQLDRVAGAAHFQVSDARARELMQAVMAALPGFLVPRLVREVAGEPCKTPIDLN